MTNEDSITLKALIDGLDETARIAEAKWGVERLPLLVDDELRGKFERQRAKTYEALQVAYQAKFMTRDILDATTKAVTSLKRGWAALDSAATADRQMPISAVTTVLEGRTHDGMVLAVVGSNAEAHHVLAAGRAMVVLTLDEIANLLAAAGSVITETKKLFPGAVVSRSRTPSPDWYPDGDEVIPFGD